jgi:hypothetical protein
MPSKSSGPKALCAHSRIDNGPGYLVSIQLRRLRTQRPQRLSFSSPALDFEVLSRRRLGGRQSRRQHTER